MSALPPFGAPLESLFTEFINTLTNASLKLDPLSESRLRALDGRSVRLVTELPTPVDDKTFTLLATDGRIEVLPYAVPEPNAIARGSIPDLLSWFVRGVTGTGRISFEGDETVLQEFTGIFRSFSPDLAEPVSGLLGNDVAANLLNVIEGAMATLRSAVDGAGSALQRGTSERYVTRASLNALLDVLDDTQSRVDRLAQRVRAAEGQTP